MSIPMKKSLSFFVFIVAFLIVTYAVREWRQHQDISRTRADFQEMQESAREKHPELPPSVALQKFSQQRAKDNLLAAKSNWEKLNTAANTFFGFFFVNSRSRRHFCEERGVDIQPFINAFSELHAREYARAAAIYSQANVKEEEVWLQVKEISQLTVERDMQDMSTALQVSAADVCRFLADHADEFAREMHLSKSNPTVYATLMGVP